MAPMPRQADGGAGAGAGVSGLPVDLPTRPPASTTHTPPTRTPPATPRPPPPPRQRPEGKSGGHGVGWTEVERYSFRVPAGWEETPVSIADLGGTEIDLR